jgi:L-glyceraldehyde 3-phosphate reductase
LRKEQVTTELRNQSEALTLLAQTRGQTLAQMAISWVLRPRKIGSISTVAIGASSQEQLKEDFGALDHLIFTEEQLTQIKKLTSPFRIPGQ